MEVSSGIFLRLNNYQAIKEKEHSLFNPEAENALLDLLTFLWETGNNLSSIEFLDSTNGIIFYGIVMAEIHFFKGFNDLNVLFSNSRLSSLIESIVNDSLRKEA